MPFGFANFEEGFTESVYDIEPGKVYDVDGNPSEKVYFPNLQRSLAWSYQDKQFILEMIERLFFDAVRVGKLREDIKIAEPHVRGADVVFFDVSAIRAWEFGANAHAPANGLSNDEACQLARYAGMSDRLTSFGLYNYNPLLDQQKHSAKSAADILWYFMEGYFGRVNDIPTANSANFSRYLVDIDQEGNHSLVFHKSRKTDRWWMQVPYPLKNSKNERFHLVPCTYEDYQTAVSGEMPDLWWRTQQKLI
jgi:hypothetical protein